MYRPGRTLPTNGVLYRGQAADSTTTPHRRDDAGRASSKRTIGLAALPVDSAHAATLASASQQGGGEGGSGGQGGLGGGSPLAQYQGRLAAIDGMISAGDCATARSEIRGMMSQSPEQLFRGDATMLQMRDLRVQMDEIFYRAANRC